MTKGVLRPFNKVVVDAAIQVTCANAVKYFARFCKTLSQKASYNELSEMGNQPTGSSERSISGIISSVR